MNPLSIIPTPLVDAARKAVARHGGAHVDTRNGVFVLPGPPWWSDAENPHYVRPDGTIRPVPGSRLADPTIPYVSRAACDARDAGQATSYCEYLDRHACEMAAAFEARGESALAAEMMTRSLAAALVGNDGD